jgi:hypothetical protein
MRAGNAIRAIAALAVLAFANIILARAAGPSAVWAFGITAVAIIGLLAAIGSGIKGRAAGVIVDNRNRVSLSKLQAAAWTVLIISGLITVAAIRMRLPNVDPLEIGIPQDLLIVMGISATSMVATPALLSIKDPGQTEASVFARSDPDKASWLDIFRGDDVSNAASPDLSKVQQFLITALLLSYYAIALGEMFFTGSFHAADGPNNSDVVHGLVDQKTQLPAFGESMIWLLGISHAGYLGYKAVPHTTRSSTALVDEVG